MSNTRTFGAPAQVKQALNQQRYIASDEIATTVYLTDQLGKPLLLEGPAGVGKTELAKSVAGATGRELIRLQCYEGLDESKALYEWEYAKQLLYTQLLRESSRRPWRMPAAWPLLPIGWRRRRMSSSRCASCSNARCSRRS